MANIVNIPVYGHTDYLRYHVPFIPVDTGGGGQNGIISALPDGNVEINAESHFFEIENLSSLFFQTDASGSVTTTLRLTKFLTQAAGLLQNDPLDITDIAGIEIDLDGTTKIVSGKSGSLGIHTPNIVNAISVPIGSLLYNTGSGNVEFLPYNFPVTAPPVGNKIIQWIDGTPAFIDTPSGGGGGSFSYDSFTLGSFTALASRFGASAITFSSPASGEFNFVIPSGVQLTNLSIFGNNTTLNASQEMVLRIDNSANSRDRRVIFQLYDANSSSQVNQFLTGTVNVQTVSANVTTITTPGLNNFAGTGFRIEIS